MIKYICNLNSAFQKCTIIVMIFTKFIVFINPTDHISWSRHIFEFPIIRFDHRNNTFEYESLREAQYAAKSIHLMAYYQNIQFAYTKESIRLVGNAKSTRSLFALHSSTHATPQSPIQDILIETLFGSEPILPWDP